MAFDAFMVVKVRGSETLKGESTDHEFGKQQASEILSFSFSSFPNATTGSQEDVIDAATGTDSSTLPSSSTSSPAASLKDPSDLLSVIKSIPILKKSFDHQEEKHKGDVESLNERIDRLANRTKAVAQQVKKVDEKIDNVSADQASGNGEQGSSSPGNTKNKAKKANKLKIVLEKFVDSASPGLLKAYCQAADRKEHNDYKPFEEVVLSFRKAGGSTPLVYLKIKLSQVDVTSYSLDSGSGSEPPRENLTLSCETFMISYTRQTQEGGAKDMDPDKILGWDFENNKRL